MELQICREDGTQETVPATEESLTKTLGEIGALQFLICVAEDESFLQDDGEVLEYGDPSGDRVLLLRADPVDVRTRGSLPAFLSFLRGDGRWRREYRWTDVSREVPTRWTDLRDKVVYALICLLVAALAAWTWYRVIREA